MGLPADHETRMKRAQLAWKALSVGDAFRVALLGNPQLPARIKPPPPWEHSGDSIMAAAVLAQLQEAGAIDESVLASAMAARYHKDPVRSYDDMTQWVLASVFGGVAWKEAAESALDASMPLGDGGAIRVAPIGAYFADDLAAVAREARAAVSPTHVRAADQIDAVAVGIATALASRMGDRSNPRNGKALLEGTIAELPDGPTRQALSRARPLLEAWDADAAASLPGVAHGILCAAHAINDFVEAMWSATPDRDERDGSAPVAAVLVALANGSIPAEWLEAREDLSGAT